ncbi:hypothetical protein B0H11DRAFT_1914683 [Mycena galericulata]|nr:hypothetical protein B0H11DRAFT_1914683 [Mycena galericulata]
MPRCRPAKFPTGSISYLWTPSCRFLGFLWNSASAADLWMTGLDFLMRHISALPAQSPGYLGPAILRPRVGFLARGQGLPRAMPRSSRRRRSSHLDFVTQTQPLYPISPRLGQLVGRIVGSFKSSNRLQGRIKGASLRCDAVSDISLTILRREPSNGETIVKCYQIDTRDSFYCHEVLNVRTEIEASGLYRAVRWGDYGQGCMLVQMNLSAYRDHRWIRPARCMSVQIYLDTRDSRSIVTKGWMYGPRRDHAAMLPPNVRMPRLLLDDPGRGLYSFEYTSGTMVPRTTNPSHAETIGWMIPVADSVEGIAGSILVQMNMNTRNSPSIVTKAPMYGPRLKRQDHTPRVQQGDYGTWDYAAALHQMLGCRDYR